MPDFTFSGPPYGPGQRIFKGLARTATACTRRQRPSDAHAHKGLGAGIVELELARIAHVARSHVEVELAIADAEREVRPEAVEKTRMQVLGRSVEITDVDFEVFSPRLGVEAVVDGHQQVEA